MEKVRERQGTGRRRLEKVGRGCKSLKENLEKLRMASKIIDQEELKVKSIDLTFDDQVVLKLL